MSAHNSPTVFVSSTCYDLAQIRSNLQSFIEGHGFRAMLSEERSFPVDPGSDNLDNCLQNLRDHADIYVLIVGMRFGSTVDDENSITKLEYHQARAVGVPIYVFLDRALLPLIDFLKENPDAKISKVDSPKVVKFAAELRNSNHWCFTYEKSEEIITTLRQQWASLFSRGLKLWRRVQANQLSKQLQKLDGEALRLLIEKPMFWEYLLYADVLVSSLSELRPLRLDADLGIYLKSYETASPVEYLRWIADKFEEFIRKSYSVKKLFSPAATSAAFGPPGVAGDPERIVHIAHRLLEFYREALEWKLAVENSWPREEFANLASIASQAASGAYEQIETYVSMVHSKISGLKVNPPAPGEKRQIDLVLEMTFPHQLNDQLDAEMAKLSSMPHLFFDRNGG